ncbi:MAG: aspartate carbamoyltransferase regulatory subunit [Candidatus Asgardarchaeum californiense]|nr:MAG: aspartate carbamoyltransferase regulatory subunit [Candidatus Asgardarchaeum californiense]
MSADNGTELRVKKIENGTVIDHIPKGRALAVLRILGIRYPTDFIVSVVMNVPSGKYGTKDVVKIENRELTEDELNKIALIAPEATINIIRSYKVARKFKVELPDHIENVVKCANPACITNTREPVKPTFTVIQKSPVILRCDYCGKYTTFEDIIEQF